MAALLLLAATQPREVARRLNSYDARLTSQLIQCANKAKACCLDYGYPAEDKTSERKRRYTAHPTILSEVLHAKTHLDIDS